MRRTRVQFRQPSGLASVTVKLWDKFAFPVDETVTDAEGRYAFDSNGGLGTVEVVAPGGFGYTLQDADVSESTGRTHRLRSSLRRRAALLGCRPRAAVAGL